MPDTITDQLRAAVDARSVIVVDALPAAPFGARHRAGAERN